MNLLVIMEKTDLTKQDLISKIIDEIAYELDPDLIEYLIDYFQNNALYSLGEDVIFEYKLIIDTNVVISNLISFCKHGNSLLHKIIKQPLLKLHAPNQLLMELDDKIPSLCEENNINEELFRHTLDNDILPNVIIYDELDDVHFNYAHNILNERDNKDVPFLALSMELKTQGIITNDKDFEEQTEVKIWKLKESRNVITVINRGMLCLFIQTQTLPFILKTGYALSIIMMSVLSNMALTIVNSSKIIISTIGTKAKKIPLWIYAILGIALISILSDEKNRKKGYEILSKIKKKISTTLFSIFINLKLYIDYMTPLLEPVVEYSVASTVVMKEYTDELLEQIKMLETNP